MFVDRWNVAVSGMQFTLQLQWAPYTTTASSFQQWPADGSRWDRQLYTGARVFSIKIKRSHRYRAHCM